LSEINHLPKRLRIVSQRIPVSVVPNLHLPCDDDEPNLKHHPAYGIYNERDQTIHLDAHLPFERQHETLLHEALHVMLKITGCDDLMTAEAPGLDEHVVTVLAPVLLAFIRENPRAMAYFAEVKP
jgi:hypothetical protein